MIDRCSNPQHKYYARYGGRGIRVCARWLSSFQLFLDDMGERPKGTTIDRINNAGDYEPNNCRWATWDVQSCNKASTHYLTIGGKTQAIAKWARDVGLKKTTVTGRIARGWTPERALSRALTRAEALSAAHIAQAKEVDSLHRKIAALLAFGLSQRQVAKRLGLYRSTIYKHIHGLGKHRAAAKRGQTR